MLKNKVSIIVPIYKVEKYLHRCIDSIITQTYTNWECILVDDGSPDGSGLICDEYANQEVRICVIHKRNGGVSSARNAALEIATGEWITFIDADDFVAKDYLEAMIKPILDNNNISFVHSGAYQTIKGKLDCYLFHKNTHISKDVKYLLENFEGYPFSKLFKRQLIEGFFTGSCIRFDENMKINEDFIFNMEYLCCCSDSYAFIRYDGYYYTCDNTQSAMSLDKNSSPNLEATRYKSKRLLQTFEKLLSTHKLVYSDVPKLTKWIADRVYTSLFNIYKMEIPRKDRMREIRAEWQTNNPAILDFCKADPVRKFSILLLKARLFYVYDTVNSLLYIIWKICTKR